MNGNFLLRRVAWSARRRADRARDARRWAEAAADYRRYLLVAPDDFAIWVQLGHALAEAEDSGGAEHAYRSADGIRPHDADLLLCWGHLRRGLGDHEGAHVLYERSLAIDGNDDAAAQLAALTPPPPKPDAEPEPEACPAVDEPEPEPEPKPAAEPETPAVPLAHPAGMIEGGHACTIVGFVVDPEGLGTTELEFRENGRVVGHTRPWVRRDDIGGFGFKTLVDVTAPAQVHAYRVADGAELVNSPFLLVASEPGRAPPLADVARFEIVKPFAMPAGGEVALFVTHSANGALKPHVMPYLRALQSEGVAVLLIAVVDRPLDLSEAVLDLVAGAMVRANAGYDFAAWAHAIRLHPEVYGARILYLANDSLFGPADSDRFGRMIARVRASDASLVGLTESHEYGWHLQSYFLGIRAPLLCSHALQSFFGAVRILPDKDAVIREYEVRLAPMMEAAGYGVEILFPSSSPMNPSLFGWRALLRDGFPFVKLLLVRGAFPEVDTDGLRDALAAAGFELELLDATVAAAAQVGPPYEDGRLLARPHRADIAAKRGLKVAFYGPWNYDNGLGFASRGLIDALRRTGARLNLHPIKKPFHVHRPLAPAADICDFAGPADVAIVHLNPDSWHLLTEEQRGAISAAGRRIGYWVWEMEHIPPAWWHEFGSVDRIWAPSRYCARLFEAQDGAGVDVIPHTVPLPVPAQGRADILATIGVPEDARVILYVFDGSSYLVRKNPAALIRAFSASELAVRGWRLVLKTKHLMDRAEEGEALRRLADASAGVTIVDRGMSAPELACLLDAASIYASPHCSEGFGLTIAEAMAAGKIVVATDYSGSVDLLDATTGFPVAAHPWTLERDFGHYTRGGRWARIDEPALTDALCRAAERVEAGDEALGNAARARVGQTLSPDAVAVLIERSLRDTVAAPRPLPPVRPINPHIAAGVALAAADLGSGIHAAALTPSGAADEATLRAISRPDIGESDWIVFAPAAGLVHPLLGRIVREHAALRPDAAIFYGDDLALDAAHAVDQLRLKPDFDPVLLAAQDYVGALLVIRAGALARLGGLRHEMGTAGLFDLLLRCHAEGLSIARIPEVLLATHGSRISAIVADRRLALASHPSFMKHEILPGLSPDTLQLARRFDADAPDLTILIPTCRSLQPDGTSYVEALLAGIAAADWPMERLTVIVGDDIAGAPVWEARAWPFTLCRIETPRLPEERFNYAAKMNRLWRAAETEQLLFLNDDVAPLAPGWIKALMTFAVDAEVGGVGARLLYADGRLQHAGIGPLFDVVAHAWLGRRRAEGSYQEWARVHRAWAMVTGAVFATRRQVMEEVGGFDERFSLEFNDIDLCLRLRSRGYRIVCTPHAELVHVEKVSRGERPPPGDERALFLARWRGWLDADPAWHPQLDRYSIDVRPRLDGGAWFM